MTYLIIGAGAAGLMAARTLSAQGKEVIVIEARNRIGGRIDTLTQDGSSGYTEGGAEFVHGNLPVTQALLKEAGIDLVPVQGTSWHIENGVLASGGLFHDDWDQFMEALNALTEDTTMEAFLKQHFNDERYTSLVDMVKRFAEGYDAADLSRVSVFALREEWQGTEEEDQYRPSQGYRQALEFLKKQCNAQAVKILLSTPAKTIHWSRNAVTVETENGLSIQGQKLLITVPVSLLQADTLSFNPPVPEIARAARAFGFGGVIKFLFTFKSRFWEDKASGFRPMPDLGFLLSDATIPTWWTNQSDSTLLTGWFAGPDAEHADHHTGALFNQALHSLAYLFDSTEEAIRKELVTWQILNWFADPYARGAYAYTTLNTALGRATLSKPIEDTIYFAGEAMYDGPAMGTVEAALASGQNVAHAMITPA